MPKQTKIVVRKLPVNFTTEELNEIGFRLASKVGEIGAVESDKKVAMDGFKERISKLEAEVAQLATDRRNGYKLTDVACELRYDFPNGRKEFVRTDTGEIAVTEPITDEERQIALDAMTPSPDQLKRAFGSTEMDIPPDAEMV